MSRALRDLRAEFRALPATKADAMMALGNSTPADKVIAHYGAPAGIDDAVLHEAVASAGLGQMPVEVNRRTEFRVGVPHGSERVAAEVLSRLGADGVQLRGWQVLSFAVDLPDQLRRVDQVAEPEPARGWFRRLVRT